MARKKNKANYNTNTAPTLQAQLKPKSQNQAEYLKSLYRSDVVFCSGPAGSGKTAIAVACACQFLVEKKSRENCYRPSHNRIWQGLRSFAGNLYS